MGAELKKIPIELDRALKLKSQLLQASLAYLDILSAGVTARNDDVQKAHADLLRWAHHLEALEDAGSIQVRGDAYLPRGCRARPELRIGRGLLLHQHREEFVDHARDGAALEDLAHIRTAPISSAR